MVSRIVDNADFYAATWICCLIALLIICWSVLDSS